MRFLLTSSVMLGLIIAPGSAGAQEKGAQEKGAPKKRAVHQVLKAGDLLDDARLADPKTLDGHFPFVVPKTTADWYARADHLRRRILVATGLWPLPDKTPLNAVIREKVARDGFTVQKVHFESLPGHFVTGLLFRPANPKSERVPGILSPHGHGGRMQQFNDQQLAKQITTGGEHFTRSGRNPKVARCAQLARMGCVAFIFDMVGYEDSIQIPFEVAHRHAESRPEEAQGHFDDGWIFFSIEADLHSQSIMGLQTWNAIRALDFLASLPDVDPDRLAVTGGSGGGTQTILLSALDDRVKVSFPNGMVSTSMQGGCYCENCNYLRIGTGNVELAALFAPKPLGMTAADDWTRDMMTDGYPQLQWLYAMLGDRKDVTCRPLLQFPHNYNYVTRATMYRWMNRHLRLGLDEPIIEQDFEPLTEAEGMVWTEDRPCPGQQGVMHEKEVCAWFDAQAQAKLAVAKPASESSLDRFRKLYGSGWSIIFDRSISKPNSITFEKLGTETADSLHIVKGIVRDQERGTSIPVLVVESQTPSARGPEESAATVVWTSGDGKSAAFENGTIVDPMLKSLLDRGATVVLPDLFGQGEFSETSRAWTAQRLVPTKKSYSAFTFGYNRPLAAERCADLLTVIGYARQQTPDRVLMMGASGSAAWAAAAAVLAGNVVSRAVIETDGFRFADATSYRDPNFVPGAVKYGDLPVLLALRAPHELMVLGESESSLDLANECYQVAGPSDAIRYAKGRARTSNVVDWLLAGKP